MKKWLIFFFSLKVKLEAESCGETKRKETRRSRRGGWKEQSKKGRQKGCKWEKKVRVNEINDRGTRMSCGHL